MVATFHLLHAVFAQTLVMLGSFDPGLTWVWSILQVAYKANREFWILSLITWPRSFVTWAKETFKIFPLKRRWPIQVISGPEKINQELQGRILIICWVKTTETHSAQKQSNSWQTFTVSLEKETVPWWCPLRISLRAQREACISTGKWRAKSIQL